MIDPSKMSDAEKNAYMQKTLKDTGSLITVLETAMASKRLDAEVYSWAEAKLKETQSMNQLVTLALEVFGI
jgi:hypothetical protein